MLGSCCHLIACGLPSFAIRYGFACLLVKLGELQLQSLDRMSPFRRRRLANSVLISEQANFVDGVIEVKLNSSRTCVEISQPTRWMAVVMNLEQMSRWLSDFLSIWRS
jgi:hypothetical protein